MSTEIFVKEISYCSFKIEKDINPSNYDENFDYILEKYQEQERNPLETNTKFSLNLKDLERLPSNINIDKSSIENNNITITNSDKGILKSIRLHKNKYGVVELYILDRKGRFERIVTLS